MDILPMLKSGQGHRDWLYIQQWLSPVHFETQFTKLRPFGAYFLIGHIQQQQHINIGICTFLASGIRAKKDHTLQRCSIYAL